MHLKKNTFKANFGLIFVVQGERIITAMRATKIIIVCIIALATGLQVFGQQSEVVPVQAERIDISKSVRIFPNPAVEYVYIKVHQFKAQDVSLTLHNIIGNEIAFESEIIDEHELRVTVKDLDAGYYLIGLKDKSSRFSGTFKFVKK